VVPQDNHALAIGFDLMMLNEVFMISPGRIGDEKSQN
jgi:hypothetical protein